MVMLHQSTDYGQFKIFHDRNRRVLTDRIYNSVKENNKLANNPIIVTKDKYVIDGQHRLDAARRLKVAIYYLIDPDATVHDIALYQTQTPWTTKDHLNFYKSVSESHEFVHRLCETYGLWNNLTFVVEFCSGVDNPTRRFKNGTYNLKAKAEILETYFCNLAEVRSEINKATRNAYLSKYALTALMSIVSSGDYTHSKFLHKIKTFPDNVVECLKYKTVKMLREEFTNRVYNFMDKPAKRK